MPLKHQSQTENGFKKQKKQSVLTQAMGVWRVTNIFFTTVLSMIYKGWHSYYVNSYSLPVTAYNVTVTPCRKHSGSANVKVFTEIFIIFHLHQNDVIFKNVIITPSVCSEKMKWLQVEL